MFACYSLSTVTECLAYNRCIKVLQRGRTNQVHIQREREKERNYKTLAHMTIEAGKFKVHRADISQFESEGRKLLQNQEEPVSQHEGCVRQENSLSVGKGLLRLSSA